MIAITLLNKENTPIGPFTREQIEQKLKSGECSLSDLAFTEGLTQWTPLREVLDKVGGTTPPVASVAPAIATARAYVQPTVPAASAPAYSYAASMQPPGHLVYAGFWLRFVAYFIDGIIISIPFFIVMMVMSGIIIAVSGTNPFSQAAMNGDTDQTASPMSTGLGLTIILVELIVELALVVVVWFYFAKLESGPHQATYGKRVLGLKVTGLSGERVSFSRATGRFFGKIISGMTFYIGFIMAGFTQKKQALHDMIAGTLVVRK